MKFLYIDVQLKATEPKDFTEVWLEVFPSLPDLAPVRSFLAEYSIPFDLLTEKIIVADDTAFVGTETYTLLSYLIDIPDLQQATLFRMEFPHYSVKGE